jgi:hypothetical protein
MSDAYLISILGELITNPINLISPLFTFVNLKIIFVAMLILSFIVTTFGTCNKRSVRHSRRGGANFDPEKIRMLKEIAKKGVNVKDFLKYSEMDVENITITNTLINAYYKYTYQLLVPQPEVSVISCILSTVSPIIVDHMCKPTFVLQISNL